MKNLLYEDSNVNCSDLKTPNSTQYPAPET